ncbi:MAG TPA: aldo/keto reductase [Tepidisphaeraceae bacterium]|jgi:aryl-alcohol dehydrogenase-like predicted oxidoreductase|nr:aldo/keto reductase [Tepidisphaeraceae bacterium]
MEKRTLGKTGFQVSVLGFGAAPAAYLAADRERTATMLTDLLDRGMNFIDTAASYPGSEEFLGETISHRRKDFVLVSKCGTKQPGIEGENWSADLIRQSVDRSLRLLKTDVIDVMLLHSCDLEKLKKGEALGALVDARKAGKIKFAGYSGDNEAAEYATTLPDVAVIETSINITDQRNIDLVLPKAKSANIGVIAKRPIANAAWKPIDNQPGMYQNYAKEYTDRFQKIGLRTSDIGFKESDWPEIALRFTLSQDGVSTAIIGTTNPANAQANITAANKGTLSAQATQKLREAFRRADPRGQWTGQT